MPSQELSSRPRRPGVGSGRCRCRRPQSPGDRRPQCGPASQAASAVAAEMVPAGARDHGAPAAGHTRAARAGAVRRRAHSVCEGGRPGRGQLPPSSTHMPERTPLGIVARTGHRLEWRRRARPGIGVGSEARRRVLRYTLATFTYGSEPICGLHPPCTTVEDQVADQPTIRQNCWPGIPSEELHPSEMTGRRSG
jgi:hypothetical protein